MTQQRSRALGRVIMAWSGIQLLFCARSARRRSWLVALPLVLGGGALSAFLLWIGYTLATTDWDDPADYPPT